MLHVVLLARFDLTSATMPTSNMALLGVNLLRLATALRLRQVFVWLQHLL